MLFLPLAQGLLMPWRRLMLLMRLRPRPRRRPLPHKGWVVKHPPRLPLTQLSRLPSRLPMLLPRLTPLPRARQSPMPLLRSTLLMWLRPLLPLYRQL
jgi:hypothetical protein